MKLFSGPVLGGMLLLSAVPFCDAAAQKGASPEVILSQPQDGWVARYAPGVWGALRFKIANLTEDDREWLIVSSLVDDPDLQFGRRIRVPARSSRWSWYPVLTPANLHIGDSQTDVVTNFYDLSDGNERLVRTRGGQMQYRNVLRVEQETNVTGYLTDRARGDSAYEAVTASRVQAGHSRRLAQFDSKFLPEDPIALDGMHQLVVAGNSLQEGVAPLRAVRQWLVDGGKIWIMLDRVDPALVERLLGDAFACEIVDRVGLTKVEFHRPGQPGTVDGPRNYEQPVELVRVIATGFDVPYTVGGWPAALRTRMGRGEVLLTTLGPRGWIRGRTSRDRPAPDSRYTNFIALKPLVELASTFFQRGEAEAVDADDFAPLVAKRIGYQVIGRGSVSAILGTFCIFLGGAGVVLTRRRRLEWLGIAGPAAAVVCGGVLFVLGTQSRSAVPATLSEAHYAEVAPETGDVHLSGMLAVYYHDQAERNAGAESGGVFLPDVSRLRGITKRMIWVDGDRWQWEHFELPPGVQMLPFERPLVLKDPPVVRAQFGPQGLSGRMTAGSLGKLDDMVIDTGSPNTLSVSPDADGSFTATPEDVSARERFVADSLLSAEQEQREEVYRRRSENRKERNFSAHPALLGWTDRLESGFRFPDVRRRVRSTLVSVPLKIEPTPPGTEVLIPAPFVRLRVLPKTGSEGVTFSVPYSNQRREWGGRVRPARIPIRFQLPAAVLPLRMERAELTVRLSGPPQKVELYRIDGDEFVRLGGVERSLGTARFTISADEGPPVDAAGELELGLFVGDFDAPPSLEAEGNLRNWKIEDLQMQVRGRTVEE